MLRNYVRSSLFARLCAQPTTDNIETDGRQSLRDAAAQRADHSPAVAQINNQAAKSKPSTVVVKRKPDKAVDGVKAAKKAKRSKKNDEIDDIFARF